MAPESGGESERRADGPKRGQKVSFSPESRLNRRCSDLASMFFHPCMMVNILRRGKNHLTKSPEICIRCIGVSRTQFGCSEKEKKATLRASLSSLVSFVVPLLFWEGDAGGGNHNGFLFSSLPLPLSSPSLHSPAGNTAAAVLSLRRRRRQQQLLSGLGRYNKGGGGGGDC